MGNLTVKTSNLAVTATYENAEKQLKFELNYNKDMDTKSLLNLNGSVNAPIEKGTYIGGFYGAPKDGVMQYNFSNITDLTKMSDIVSCVQEIESLIKNEE
jgi:hypothetical protein